MYENPITIICQGIQTQIVQRDEQMILEAIQKQGVFVDKEELIKAMNYDRNQYSKGYKDGVSDVLDKIRAEIWDLQYGDEEKSMTDEDRADAYNNVIRQVIEIIDEYKTEGSEG